MKKIVKWILGLSLICSVKNNLNVKNFLDSTLTEVYEQSVAVSAKNIDLSLSAKSAYLMDYDTQTVMYSENETKRLPIASMCKIMTLILSFEAIDSGIISANEEIVVSEKASSMGGSQVFLESNEKYKVSELIKSIVVCSANDSCVAMAEKIAGSETLFVEKMNEKAKALGANDTLFANCTGLPKEPQYSCAKDVAIMMKELLSHNEYFQFGKVWLDKFNHPTGRHTEITNTNKLIRFYEGCDGGKTGFTNEAGFCLAATAKRNDLRVISVVIGEENSATRFQDVRTMFDYAFANFTTIPLVQADVTLLQKATVNNGKKKELPVYVKTSKYGLLERSEQSDYTTQVNFEKLSAPIKKDEKVGEIILFKSGVEFERVSLFAKEEVKRANFFDGLKEIAGKWNK